MAKTKESISDKLCKAAREGDVDAVQQLLAVLDLEQDSEVIDRALIASLFGGWKVEVSSCLLSAGANPNQVTSVGTLLMGAAMNGDLPLVKRLIAAGADLNREVNRETALSAALSENQRPVVEYLEKLGAKSPASATLLYASMHGDLERAKQALAKGAELERPGGTFDETPLMTAASHGQAEAVRLLLKHGANPNKKVEGKTALYNAALHGGSLETVDALVAAGANIHADWYDTTILMAAAGAGNMPVVRRLVELGAKADARDKDRGMSVLDHAKASKNKELVAYLKSLGATADRDLPRALARVLAKKFGGRPVEHVAGFMLNAKFHGLPCQFSIGTEGFSLFIRGLDFGASEFKRSKDGQIVVSTSKPEFQRQKVERVEKVLSGVGLVAFRTKGLSPLPANFVASFCDKHRVLFGRLKLSKKEVVRLGANFAAFACPLVDFNLAEPRLKAFARLIQGLARPPQPERILFKGEWLLKPGPKAATACGHKFGGKSEQPVACPHCGCATNLMAQVDLSDSILPKTALGRGQLPVFWCLDCLEWDAAFFDASGQVPRPLNKTGKQSNPAKLETGEEDLPERRVTLVPVAAGKKAGRKSKLGGSPTWIQMEQTPDCPKCEKPMAFVLQLTSDSRISYGDMGMLYTFACPECRITASLIQSH